MPHMMIDLETLSTKNNAVITQIAAVVFEPNEIDILFTYEAYPDLNTQLGMNRHIDIDTIRWWLKQSEEARLNFDRVTSPLHKVCSEFCQTFLWEEIEGIWSHGSIFDIVILEDFMKDCGFKIPWDFRKVRDTRTLFSLIPTEMEKATVKHSAIGDAMAQALTVQKAYAKLDGLKKLFV